MNFNLFQKLIHQWEALHPYNGVQALKIRGQLDLESSRQAWHDAMEILGLGAVQVRGSSYRFECLNGESINHTVQLCPAQTSLEDLITQEINRPFGPIDSVPFRPFAVQEGDHYWLGLTYRHWVADSASIRMLMHEWFVRQFDRAAAATRPLRTQTGGYVSLFPPYRSGWDAGETLLACMRWQTQFKRARRIEDQHAFRDLSVKFKLLDPMPGIVEGLRAASRSAGVTVNDLFLAAIAEACNQYVPAGRKFHRQNLAIGSIVDLRTKARQPLQDVFDLLLGFTSVNCRPQDFERWENLVADIGQQTRRQKEIGFAEASWLRMFGGVVVGKVLSGDSVISFYRKRIALAGAISNVNLNRCWASRYHPDPLVDYVRAAPTGPLTPLVFTTTTLGEGLTVGLTYRHAIVNAAQAENLGANFENRLRNVADPATKAATIAK